MWKQYRRIQIAEMRPFDHRDADIFGLIEGVSISEVDRKREHHQSLVGEAFLGK